MKKTLFAIGVLVIAIAIVYMLFGNRVARISNSIDGGVTREEYVVNRETPNYIIDVKVARTGRPTIDTIVVGNIDEQIRQFEKEYSQQAIPVDQQENSGIREGVKYSLSITGNYQEAGGFYSVVIQSSQYTGGAHGNHTITTLVFNQSGKLVGLDEFFRKDIDYYQKLSEIAIPKIQTHLCSLVKENDPEGANTSEHCQGEVTPELHDGAGPNKENYQSFSITNTGIKFYFQPYQVAAYVFGAPEIEFTWQELEGIAVPFMQ